MELWDAVNTQWRVGFSGRVGLDFPAVFQIAKVLDIPVTKPLFKKLSALERFELELQAEKLSGDKDPQARPP